MLTAGLWSAPNLDLKALALAENPALANPEHDFQIIANPSNSAATVAALLASLPPPKAVLVRTRLSSELPQDESSARKQSARG